MTELYTKEFLEEVTGKRWVDQEVAWLNTLIKAYREGKKLYIIPARGSTKYKNINTYNTLCVLESEMKSQINFDKFIAFYEKANKIIEIACPESAGEV